MPIVRIAADAIVGQYVLVEIRPFEAADAEAVAEIIRPLQPGILVTTAYLAYRERAEPERAKRRSWLAEENGEVLGFATSAVKWDEPGAVGRLWIGVRPVRRKRGVGAALYELAEDHAQEAGVQRLTVEVDDDPDGRRFVEARGYEAGSAEIISSLDPRRTDLGELDALAETTAAAGFELQTMQALEGRQDDLRDRPRWRRDVHEGGSEMDEGARYRTAGHGLRQYGGKLKGARRRSQRQDDQGRHRDGQRRDLH